MRTVVRVCPVCHKRYEFILTPEEAKMYNEYINFGMHLIQEVFPNRTPSERELLRPNGICRECWDKMFSFADDDDDYDNYVYEDDWDDDWDDEIFE